MRTITRLPLSVLATVMGFAIIWMFKHPNDLYINQIPNTLTLHYYINLIHQQFDIDIIKYELWITYAVGTTITWMGALLALGVLYGASLGRPLVGSLIERSKRLTATFITLVIIAPITIPENQFPHPLAPLAPLCFFVIIFGLCFILTIPKRQAERRRLMAKKRLQYRPPVSSQPMTRTTTTTTTASESAMDCLEFTSNSSTTDTSISWDSNRKSEEATLILMMQVALSNGAVSDAEHKILLQFAQKLFLFPADYKRLLIEAKKTMSHQEPINATLKDFHAACSVAYADGYLDEKEYKMLLIIGKRMGLSKEAINGAIIAQRKKGKVK